MLSARASPSKRPEACQHPFVAYPWLVVPALLQTSELGVAQSSLFWRWRGLAPCWCFLPYDRITSSSRPKKDTGPTLEHESIVRPRRSSRSAGLALARRAVQQVRCPSRNYVHDVPFFSDHPGNGRAIQWSALLPVTSQGVDLQYPVSTQRGGQVTNAVHSSLVAGRGQRTDDQRASDSAAWHQKSISHK